MSEFRRTAVVDLDGTLAMYDGWRGSDHIGDPVPFAREAMCEPFVWAMAIFLLLILAVLVLV